MVRKTRSDKGKKRNYPKKRKKARPTKVKAHTRGGPLALGSLWGNERGLKAGKLFTEEDKKGIPAGNIWGKRKKWD